VPVAIAHDFGSFRYHRQVAENAMLADIDTGQWGALTVGGVPWHFSRTPCAVQAPQFIDDGDTESRDAVLARAPLPVAEPRAPLLQGLRVLEWAEGVAGPLAAVRLGDLGAVVDKIEGGAGDWLRRAAPPGTGSDVAAAHFELNRGKRVQRLADGAQGAAQLRTLLAAADVFITDRSDAELAEYGVDVFAQQGCRANPKLIAVRITPWGARGPLAALPGSELTVQAMAGYTRYLGRHGEPARRLGADVAGTGAAMFARQAVLAALFARRAGGDGQTVELSLFNALLTLKSVHLAAQSDPDDYIGPRAGAANYPPDLGWRAADGRLYFIFGGSVGADGKAGWTHFVEEVGLSALLEDARFDKSGRNSTGHGVRAHALAPEYERAFVRYPAETLGELVRRHGGSAAVYQGLDAALDHAQTRALDIVRTVRAADGRAVRVRAYPARFSALQTRLQDEPPAGDGGAAAFNPTTRGG
jgi:formyl-CoA transferase